MPENNTSPLVNMTALNAAYDLIKQQLDERVYKTSINPNEVLGSADAPYPSAYIGSNVLDNQGIRTEGPISAVGNMTCADIIINNTGYATGAFRAGKQGNEDKYSLDVYTSSIGVNVPFTANNGLTANNGISINSNGESILTAGSNEVRINKTLNIYSGVTVYDNISVDRDLSVKNNCAVTGSCDFSSGALKTSANSVIVPAGSVFTVEGNANLGGNVVLANSTALINQSYALFTTPVQINNATASTSLTTGALTVTGGIGASGDIWGAHVHNAVGNDIADAITTGVDLEPGYCYAYDGNRWFKTEGKDSPYMGIHSDTAGYILGYDKSKKQILISVGGFVLAYTDKIYDPGTFLTYANDGLLTEAKEGDERIAKFFRTEPEPYYHNIKVNGRNWVKVMH